MEMGKCFDSALERVQYMAKVAKTAAMRATLESAAGEIESLRQQLDQATNVLSAYGIVEISKGVFCATPDAQAQKIERLRAELEAVKFQLEQYEISDLGAMQEQLEERRLACNQALKQRDELAKALSEIRDMSWTESEVFEITQAALAKLGADKTGEAG